MCIYPSLGGVRRKHNHLHIKFQLKSINKTQLPTGVPELIDSKSEATLYPNLQDFHVGLVGLVSFSVYIVNVTTLGWWRTIFDSKAAFPEGSSIICSDQLTKSTETLGALIDIRKRYPTTKPMPL
ncbi:hypothetical protein DSO57_1027220 [Entomophthora muscae]|uniref:Uncharacterized protein n=1 Tax=Entomophthora muscae TaxID=34485 RepID=A0ACC2UMP3_9FUNG|nr:hypothetical protein DSO57_1027220 [Entomophthora muscae]